AMDRAPILNDLTEIFDMNGILYLEQLIGNEITPKVNRNNAISARQKILITLRYLATGPLQLNGSDLHKVSQPTVSRVLTRVIDVLSTPEIGGHANGYYLLGDSGYPAKRWLLTPYLAPQNATEEGYNRSHKITRALVERSIGQLKKRVIVACCVLHNICKERAIPINGDDDSDDEDDNADDQLAQGVQQPPNAAGNRFRDHGHDFHAGAAVTAAVVVSVVAATTSRTVDRNIYQFYPILSWEYFA
ncbi:HARB1-like protein, partial [Mya arenaria]